MKTESKANALTSRQWLILGSGAVVTLVASLSVHVVMLQLLGVPYPNISEAGRIGMLIPLSQMTGMILLSRIILGRFPQWSLFLRWLVLAGLYSAITGVARNALMEGVTTTGYVKPVASLFYQLVSNLILAALATALARWAHNVLRTLIGAFAVTAFMLLVLPAVMGTALALLMAWAETLARPEIYTLPYGPNVLIPSYVAFLETVSACLLVAFLVTGHARAAPLTDWLRFGVTIMLVRGMLVAMFIAGPLIGSSPAAGILSVSQFFLQDLVLVVIAWVVVQSVRRSQPRPDFRR